MLKRIAIALERIADALESANNVNIKVDTASAEEAITRYLQKYQTPHQQESA